MSSPTSPSLTAPSPWSAGLQALRRYYRPFLLVQALAIALGLMYANSASVRAACVALATLKEDGGLAFIMLTGGLAGGVLPELFKWVAAPGTRPWRHRGGHIAFNTAFFALNGLVVDGLYAVSSRLFGDRADVTTILAKAAFDQFVFTPVWLTVIVLLFLWEKNGFDPVATYRATRPRFYATRLLPLLLPNWCFWIPMVFVIYALPAPLQFMMFLLALAAWSLLMVFIATSDETTALPERS